VIQQAVAFLADFDGALAPLRTTLAVLKLLIVMYALGIGT
jgi:hypothetical protein